MENLETEKGCAERLATYQNEAAENISESIANLAEMTSQIMATQRGGGIWWDHGIACFPGITGLRRALEARQSATESIAGVSTDLADNLREAARSCNEIDEQNGDSIDDQILAP